MPAKRNLTVEALELSDQIKPLFAGVDPNVVGGALADLVALYIAGHRTGSGNKAARAKIQTDVLELWIRLLDELIPGQNAMIDAHIAAGDSFNYHVMSEDKPRSRH